MTMVVCANCKKQHFKMGMSLLKGYDPRVGEISALVCPKCTQEIFEGKWKNVSIGCAAPKEKS